MVLEIPFPTERYWIARESSASGIPLEQVIQPGSFFASMVLRIPSPTQTGQDALGGGIQQQQVAQVQKVFFFMETPFPQLETPHNLSWGRNFCLHKPNQHRPMGAQEIPVNPSQSKHSKGSED